MRRFVLVLASAALLFTPAADARAQSGGGFAPIVPPAPVAEDCGQRSHPTATASIRVGATCTSELTSRSLPWMRNGRGEHGEIWLFDVQRDGCVEVNMRSSAIDSYLEVGSTLGSFPVLARNDDGGGYPNAKVQMRLPRAGTYYIFATALQGSTPQVGRYTLSVERSSC